MSKAVALMAETTADEVPAGEDELPKATRLAAKRPRLPRPSPTSPPRSRRSSSRDRAATRQRRFVTRTVHVSGDVDQARPGLQPWRSPTCRTNSQWCRHRQLRKIEKSALTMREKKIVETDARQGQTAAEHGQRAREPGATSERCTETSATFSVFDFRRQHRPFLWRLAPDPDDSCEPDRTQQAYADQAHKHRDRAQQQFRFRHRPSPCSIYR